MKYTIGFKVLMLFFHARLCLQSDYFSSSLMRAYLHSIPGDFKIHMKLSLCNCFAPLTFVS
jgi:hypothetical protein